MLPKDFYKLVENPNYLKHVLYSDTDSIYILIPKIKETTKEKLDILNIAAENINKSIANYLTEYVFPKQNINPKYNFIDFKTELLIDSLFFIDVKKTYAYTILAKEGVIFEKPKIKYTGGQFTKNDQPLMAKALLKQLVEDVMLNPLIKSENKIKKINEVYNEYYNNFVESSKKYEFSKIGIPGAWKKKEYIVYGMKLYNYIMDQEIFSSGSAGRFIYSKFGQYQMIKKSGIPYDKLKGICVPFVYDQEKVTQKFQEYKIEVDYDEQWKKILTKTGERIIEIAKRT